MLIPRDPFAAGGLTRVSAPQSLNMSGTNAEVVFTPARTRVSYVMVLQQGIGANVKCFLLLKRSVQFHFFCSICDQDESRRHFGFLACFLVVQVDVTENTFIS